MGCMLAHHGWETLWAGLEMAEAHWLRLSQQRLPVQKCCGGFLLRVVLLSDGVRCCTVYVDNDSSGGIRNHNHKYHHIS